MSAESPLHAPTAAAAPGHGQAQQHHQPMPVAAMPAGAPQPILMAAPAYGQLAAPQPFFAPPVYGPAPMISSSGGEQMWLCRVCGNCNFAHRTECNLKVCAAPRGFPGPFVAPVVDAPGSRNASRNASHSSSMGNAGSGHGMYGSGHAANIVIAPLQPAPGTMHMMGHGGQPQIVHLQALPPGAVPLPPGMAFPVGGMPQRQ